jgi:hypothetical protein
MGRDRRAQNLHALQPDPLESIAEEVERYVAALQEFADSDPDLAGRQAWNQIRLAGMRGGRRSEVLDSLNRIFRPWKRLCVPVCGAIERCSCSTTSSTC